MTHRWLLVIAGLFVASSALANPPPVDPGIPALSPPRDPQAWVDPTAVADTSPPVIVNVAENRPVPIVHARSASSNDLAWARDRVAPSAGGLWHAFRARHADL